MKPNQSQPELTAGILKRVGTVAVFLVIIAAILFLYTKYTVFASDWQAPVWLSYCSKVGCAK